MKNFPSCRGLYEKELAIHKHKSRHFVESWFKIMFFGVSWCLTIMFNFVKTVAKLSYLVDKVTALHLKVAAVNTLKTLCLR